MSDINDWANSEKLMTVRIPQQIVESIYWLSEFTNKLGAELLSWANILYLLIRFIFKTRAWYNGQQSIIDIIVMLSLCKKKKIYFKALQDSDRSY